MEESGKRHTEYAQYILDKIGEATVEGIYFPYVIYMSADFFYKCMNAYNSITKMSVIERFNNMKMIDGSYGCCILVREMDEDIKIEKWNRK